METNEYAGVIFGAAVYASSFAQLKAEFFDRDWRMRFIDKKMFRWTVGDDDVFD